jgi:predicted house-cleaning NTP pyrophosphatase (Maf/HAM1 superfamily)
VAGGGGKTLLGGVAVSRVKARRLPEATLARLSRKHLDKTGAYAVQDVDDPFIERVEGPFDNVIGLPVALTLRLVERASRR